MSLTGLLAINRFRRLLTPWRASARKSQYAKHIVLGLVTTKSGRLEGQDELLRRIEEASKYVPIENLSLSPQCGCVSGAAGNLLSWDDQRRKLELVVEIARKVWQ